VTEGTSTKVVLVLLDGRAATINYANDHIKGIVHAWFPGEMAGRVCVHLVMFVFYMFVFVYFCLLFSFVLGFYTPFLPYCVVGYC
jgi:hypothetical protein